LVASSGAVASVRKQDLKPSLLRHLWTPTERARRAIVELLADARSVY
jgi:hypothetical protein